MAPCHPSNFPTNMKESGYNEKKMAFPDRSCHGGRMCTPVIALGGTNIFYVDTANKKSLNMRSDCTMGDNIIASIPYRAEVTVYEFLAGDAWARVEYNGLMGFVMTRYLSGTRPASGGSGGSGGGSSSSTAISYKGFTPAYYTATVKPSNPSGYVNMRWAPSKSPPFMRCTMPETCCR